MKKQRPITVTVTPKQLRSVRDLAVVSGGYPQEISGITGDSKTIVGGFKT